jgi:hypothetical protein
MSIGLAQTPAVPSRQIPPSVLVEVQLLENRFDLALAMDCDTSRCFSKGCSYIDHAVADRPRESSLPGLSRDPGPSTEASQEYLTSARCSFAHEKDLATRDVKALVGRLQAKLSAGWTVVAVTNEVLQPIPQYLREPAPPEAEPEPELEPELSDELSDGETEEWTWATAGPELWSTLLPHFFWMIGLGLVTVAAVLMIWVWRRVGKASLEDQALLAQLALPDPGDRGPTVAVVTEGPDPDEDYVAEQQAAWAERLQGLDEEHPDPQLQALIRELLRTGSMPLLAKAVLRFPQLPAAFPSGGDVAGAKLALADYLTSVDEDALPSDVAFFESLNRYALSSSLASQSDTKVLRSLREDFGAAGLASLIASLPPRAGALLFALAPAPKQQELVALMSPVQRAEKAGQLLASNRMDRTETTALFQVLRAARNNAPLPSLPVTTSVTDRGTTFGAPAAVSVLLSTVIPHHRAALFDSVLQRFHGTLPAWHREILVPDMLLQLSDESRTDLFLGVEVENLAAWLSLVEAETRQRLLGAMPGSLRATVQAMSAFPSQAHRYALADRGRRDLARGFQLQLARANLPFERVVQVTPAAEQ